MSIFPLDSTKGNFGLAEPKIEGGKFWPNDYLVMNGHRPPKGFYNKIEIEKFRKLGYEDYWIGC